ncbi:UDP-glucose 4-epimerase GalE [Microvirga terrae]|uniref:UDP-glucose 4-epimerase n=1 Tax=Microvirga terrae TaxID=2740529 RepID=A0ABY5RNS5_9HYPH|nr:UDP-glucose 4-epimerase GalE [Microvirga terrae]UVF18437.1 UDP-glucose 4-epimerase GalE [Microvirga terrae]
MSEPYILVTGGAGFIGSHACKQLAAQGYIPVAYDNLSTGHADAVRWGPLITGDILNTHRLEAVVREFKPVAAMHFAACASVAESVADPAKYYLNNIMGTSTLLRVCEKHGIGNLIFSSSCATYGAPEVLPIRESTAQQPINPYGGSKLVGEMLLADYAALCDLRYVALRYFNACGADLDGDLGERHTPETHLIPRVLMAASGEATSFELFGDDYETPDGTCIRDYIHVCDLVAAHVLALRHLLGGGESLALNVGTGSGLSVREIVDAVSRITGYVVPTVIKPRRPGDPPALYADPSLIQQKLGFRAKYSDIDTIVRTAAPWFSLDLQPPFRVAV